ncbi:MAG: hypothetical protein U1D54_15620, partial [Limnobacter sp.]|nr:hypothetical protein [Limnobacter sp.]
MIHPFLLSVATVSLLLSACGGDSSSTSSAAARVGASAANTSNPFPGYQSTLYTGTSNWLCHPDLMGTSNVCNGNFDSTAVAADATATTLS